MATAATPRQFKHKRGDTWSRAGIAGIRTPDGQLMDLTGWQLRSQAREKDGDRLVCEFVCTLVDPITQTYTHVRQDTTDWPVCDLVTDVEFTSPTGFNVSTETFEIKVLEDQTRPVIP